MPSKNSPLILNGSCCRMSTEGEDKKMKRTILAASLGITVALNFADAQTTSYSDIVGYQTVSVPAGLSTAGFPLLNADLAKTLQLVMAKYVFERINISKFFIFFGSHHFPDIARKR